MQKLIKPLFIATVLTAAFNAQAVQKDITVNANVDATVDMTQADGTALPGTITMQYIPGRGLSTYSLNTKIWSNSATANINVALVSAAQLNEATSGTAVPLKVTLGADLKTITTTPTPFTYANLFPAGNTNGSSILPLKISQTTLAPLTTGTYSGVVSLLITQATTQS
ncbi:CS1 type fimbrial major subunit [Rahnella sikkimica]|uniref:Fimbrial protein n=1 Tax=Rahnella sikkimica TaxID=1805933 RepID=A0A2L1UXY8_9GAMM|nr:CS1 type fimbrial major subunit [Rahnella sikkimica]AVF37761.1 fimbrial protein [Rahnella sikkimica]